MLIIYTGDGKGKTTAAIGLAIRAIGRGLHVAIVQFIKTRDWRTGEWQFFKKFFPNIKYEILGAGFSWQKPKYFPSHEAAALEAWKLSKKLLKDDELDVIILDELNVALYLGYLNINEVCNALNNFKKDKHIVVTGRNAHQKLLDIADIVTEMRKIKHHFDKGRPALKGIDL